MIKNRNKKIIEKQIYIILIIMIGFLIVSVLLFNDSWKRMAESILDLVNSISYIFGGKNASVLEFSPSLKITVLLPLDWHSFKIRMSEYISRLVDMDNFLNYAGEFGEITLFVFMALPVLFFVVVLVAFVNANKNKTVNNDYNLDTKALSVWKKISHRFYRPLKKNCELMHYWFSFNPALVKLMMVITVIDMNLFTLAVEAMAFHLYIVFTYDFTYLYIQFYKFVLDVLLVFQKGWFLAVPVFLYYFNKIRKQIGYVRLLRLENKNIEFINSMPIVYLTVGTMNKKKTTSITDFALTTENIFREKALELLHNNAMKFPAFPWINLENDLRRCMDEHIVFNLASCRKYIRVRQINFGNLLNNRNVKAVVRHYKKQHTTVDEVLNKLCYSYDYENNTLTYNDGLKLNKLWDVLEVYAQLYFVYIVQSSLILSNYAIRDDSISECEGNFPIWHNNFFCSDSRLIDETSKYSHILDFDMLRIGKKVLENNEKINSFEFGIINITEAGKERGNMLDMQELKKKDDEANQKNDMFNSWLKMIRHAGTVDGFPFVSVIMDEQRAMSMGADVRELCYLNEIEKTEDSNTVLPFYGLEAGLHRIWQNHFYKSYTDYRYRRGDNTLFMHVRKSLYSKFNGYITKLSNTFGYSKVTVNVQHGSMEKPSEAKNYYLMYKKIYSKRFSTDAFSDYFAVKSLNSMCGIVDMESYRTERAGFDELQKQNSYFIIDLMRHSSLTESYLDKGHDSVAAMREKAVHAVIADKKIVTAESGDGRLSVGQTGIHAGGDLRSKYNRLPLDRRKRSK